MVRNSRHFKKCFTVASLCSSFWTKPLKHFDLILLTCTVLLFYVRVEPHMLYEWADITNMCWDATAMRHEGAKKGVKS